MYTEQSEQREVTESEVNITFYEPAVFPIRICIGSVLDGFLVPFSIYRSDHFSFYGVTCNLFWQKQEMLI